MKKQLFILFLALTVLAPELFPQSAGEGFKRKTGVLIGISHDQLLEGSLNNLVHRGEGFNAGLDRELNKDRSIRQFELVFGAAFLKSKYEDEMASFRFRASASYRYLSELCCMPSGHGIYAGGQASVDYHIEYFENWDENHFYWLTSYSLGPCMRYELPVRNITRFRVDADLPLISLVSKPHGQFMYIQSESEFLKVLKTMHETPRLVFPGRHFEMNLSVKYFFQHWKKATPALYWKWNYMNSNLSGSAQGKISGQALGLEVYF